LKPDLLSILIGVNDHGKGVPLEQFEQVYDQLLSAAKVANPKLKLALGEPFGKPGGILDEATKRAPADYWIWDSVHPTYRGQQLMADEWERVVRDFWK
jgi:lysophospholipase L1-like esterase